MTKIRHQTWLELDDCIQLTLHEPFWSAWQKFGWEQGIPGLGISVEAIKYAFKVGKKVRVAVLKYGKYEISAHMALRRAKEHNSYYLARDGKKLAVIPRTAFDIVEKTEIQKKEAEIKEKIRDKSIQMALI